MLRRLWRLLTEPRFSYIEFAFIVAAASLIAELLP